MSTEIGKEVHDQESEIQTDRLENSLPSNPTAKTDSPRAVSFAETALRLGGKSADEAQRTGVLDTADDQVETLFAPQYQTVNSPIHKAVWDREVDTYSFLNPESEPISENADRIIERCVEIVRQYKAKGDLLDGNNKIAKCVLEDLGQAGYWGLLVSSDYGGSGFRFREFAQLITRMASVDPTVAGLASVHGCIGAVDPVRTFGTKEQKEKFLPSLASGKRLSGFALTEPCAGSDLTALRTTAIKVGDEYVVNGEKLFITNVLPGRTIGLVCLIENKPAVLVVDLPETEGPNFQLKKYGLYALRHTHNNGFVFKDFRVPAANLLEPVVGDGLTIAYHGLNLGRIALCANASGAMRLMLADMLPWANFRKTYGEAIERRELVQRRIGKMAGMIVACDALVDWCSGLIDQGYRGEMECVIAKIFGSESQKEAAIELYMKTHGGRSFLHGHLFGDNVHEFLAPCIYEGEGEMLGMAFFKSLVKQHGKRYFEAIGMTLAEHHIKSPNPFNPMHAWWLRKPLWEYGTWLAQRQFSTTHWSELPEMPSDLRRHAVFAQRYLSTSGDMISKTMRQHQLRLADRQCRISDISLCIQSAVTMLTTSLYASRQDDPITRQAADVVCRNLRNQLIASRPSDGDYRASTKLGKAIAESGWKELNGIDSGEIMMGYEERR